MDLERNNNQDRIRWSRNEPDDAYCYCIPCWLLFGFIWLLITGISMGSVVYWDLTSSEHPLKFEVVSLDDIIQQQYRVIREPRP